MNTQVNLETASKAEISAAAKKPSTAKAKRERPSKGTTVKGPLSQLQSSLDQSFGKGAVKVVKVRPNKQAAKDIAASAKANAAYDAAEPSGTAGKGVFGAITGSLTAEQAEQAETTAIAAIAKARKPAKAIVVGSPRTNLTERFCLGAYTGKAGAMYAFIMRCGTLGDTFSREDAIASIAAKPAHDKLATRAQVLDYFAWAARHGLLHVAADQSVPTEAQVLKAVKGKAATQKVLTKVAKKASGKGVAPKASGKKA